ncbi:MAG: phosphoribosyltransferase [Firmicutes bacterium]|nr:phosphoribosyltransferase [Bacillota bacterium]
MRFADRREAGQMLAQEIKGKDYQDVLILAVPRGGVVVAQPIARELKAPLDLIIPRKLGAPSNPELAIGAVAPDGGALLLQGYERFGLSQDSLKRLIEKETSEIRRRMNAYRGDRPMPETAGKTVILVDDGIATGFTVEAGIQYLRRQPVKKLVLAVPVAPPDTIERLRPQVDEIVCLQTPSEFYAVGQFYRDFSQTTDQEVIEILKGFGAEGH